MDIKELKARIDLDDLAGRLGLVKPKGSGNYRSPHHADKSPSLSVYADGKKWKDFSGDEGGDCVDLVMFVEKFIEPGDAIRRLHEIYGFSMDLPKRDESAPRPARSKIEFIADNCMKTPAEAFAYLQSRGIPLETLEAAAKAKAIGFNNWFKPDALPGTLGYGGPAAAFIIRDWHSNLPVAVDMRYIDPEMNGGVKTQTQGEKDGAPWFLSRRHIERAKRVIVVESAINALCVEACNKPFTAALAIRGTGNASNIDWRILRGKEVILALDADQPNDKGKRPGAEAAWTIYEALTGLDVAVLMVDHATWYADGYNDIADIAKKEGVQGVREALDRLEPWAIPGLAGTDAPSGRQRVYLPYHDFAVYWRYRCKPDFTTYISKVEEDGEDGAPKPMKFEDVCGFRVASVSRVQIQSATATFSGEPDSQPAVVFAVSAQVPRHGPKLQRRVLDDAQLHNVDQWKKLGPVFSPSRFSRLINILERTADCGARDAVNFVGLCWRNGSPALNEGPDTYFTEPEKQCPYHGLIFPSGSKEDARRVIAAYQSTFQQNAAATLLVWALGAHLKAFLGFWPHCVLQADKGSGKSTLIKRLERSIAMTMFGGQSLQTEFRLVTSMSHTSHPVGWEELSARRIDIIDKAVAALQENYQFTVSRRGSEMTEYVQCAPVLLAGEDVPVNSLIGKLVRTTLSGRKGPLMPQDLPRFPVREWILHLATMNRESVGDLHAKVERRLWEGCRADRGDDGAARMVNNYAAIGTAWLLLADWAGIAREQGEFLTDLRAEMNAHIAETHSERQPWIWIVEKLVSEIESKRFTHPFAYDMVDTTYCLLVRPQHVMDHIATDNRLRDFYNSLPVKSGRIFKRQLETHAVIVRDDVERRFSGRRHAHLTALSIEKLAEYGIHVSAPIDNSGNDQMTVAP